MAGVRRRYLTDLLARIAPFLALFAVVYTAASLLFAYLEPQVGLFNAFYWAIVTISTAGYGDIVPTNTLAKLDAMATLFIQIFLLGYLISVITSAVTSEQQKRQLGILGTDLKGHIVVLGYGGVGRAAVRELLAQDQTVAVVADRAEDVPNVRALAPEKQLFVTYGPPAERDVLNRTNIGAAHAVIVASEDDATNMIAALNVRSIAPEVRVIVSISRAELRDTLRTAGVTFVASPADMGGRLCASAAFEPDVADALDDLTQGEIHADVQEFRITDRTPISRTSFGEADRRVREASGCILIGYAHPNGAGEFRARVNPEANEPLGPGDALILIGTVENTKRFRKWYGIDQGR